MYPSIETLEEGPHKSEWMRLNGFKALKLEIGKILWYNLPYWQDEQKPKSFIDFEKVFTNFRTWDKLGWRDVPISYVTNQHHYKLQLN